MLQVGFGEADITPRAGIDMPGGFYPNKSAGVLEKLMACACVVSDGTSTVALVGVDALAVTREIVADARKRIEAATKVRGDHVLVNANHTHTGGPTVSVHETPPDPEYHAIIVGGIASAVEQATRAMHAAEVGVGSGHDDTIGHNRRFLMKDGREITHPGKPGTEHHGDIVRPAGPTDPEVGVLAFRATGSGPVLGVVVNYGCHSTIAGGNKYHPDYATYLRKHLRARYGESSGAVFLLGPCGDVTQVDNLAAGSEFGPEYAELCGMKLAAEAQRVVRRMDWVKEAKVAATVEMLPLTVRPEPDVDREKPPYGLGSGPDEAFAHGLAKVAATRAKTPVVPVEIQTIRVGDLGIAANPAEFFAELGLRIKAASPMKSTWVAELSNEVIWYVPTPQAFLAGGYESRTTESSMWAIDAGQRIIEASLRGLNAVQKAP